MEPKSEDERSKIAVRWLIIAILLAALLFAARHVNGQASAALHAKRAVVASLSLDGRKNFARGSTARP